MWSIFIFFSYFYLYWFVPLLSVLQHTLCTSGVLCRQDGKLHAVQFLAPADSDLTPSVFLPHTQTHSRWHVHTNTTENCWETSRCSPVFSMVVLFLQNVADYFSRCLINALIALCRKKHLQFLTWLSLTQRKMSHIRVEKWPLGTIWYIHV